MSKIGFTILIVTTIAPPIKRVIGIVMVRLIGDLRLKSLRSLYDL